MRRHLKLCHWYLPSRQSCNEYVILLTNLSNVSEYGLYGAQAAVREAVII